VVQVHGYTSALSRKALAWARRKGRRILLFGDSELITPRSFWKSAAKRVVLPQFFRSCHGFLTVGDRNEEYYRHYGVEWHRLFRCPFPTDIARLSQAARSRPAAIRMLRDKFGLPDDALIALVVGKHNPSKCVDHPIRAVCANWREGLAHKVFLVVAGDGVERTNLEKLARSLEPDAVKFAGFVDVVELPNYYAGSDFLIHPSEVDSHPLATTEAVLCGLPVIASDRVGSVGPTDDVRVGFNGLQYRWGDLATLTGLIRHLCTHPEALANMRMHSERIAGQRTLPAIVEAYIGAVLEVCRRAAAE